MKRLIFLIIFTCILSANCIKAQPDLKKADTSKTVLLDEVIVNTSRIPETYKLNTNTISLINPDILNTMPRSIAADEALRLVPGIRIDNQANGSRLHMSIRGQGILSERGLRGIKVLIDGIPVNDPSGFAPDLYDVDWETVNKIEVLRGPSASSYCGSGAAGVLNIITQNGSDKKIGGKIYSSIGSNGFIKGLSQIDGKIDNGDYRISFSKMKGDGYRDHTAFWANNLSDKLNY